MREELVQQSLPHDDSSLVVYVYPVAILFSDHVLSKLLVLVDSDVKPS